MDNNEQMENMTYEQDGLESSTVDQTGLEGKIRISEDVISQLAIKALLSVEGIQPANPGLMVNLRMGRKAANGVRISLSDGETPEIQVDTYVLVKYSLRIPDVCWDVQEAVKDQIERYTGYSVKSVNVYVQGITFPDSKPIDSEDMSQTSAPEV